jgi:hypothetical protein
VFLASGTCQQAGTAFRRLAVYATASGERLAQAWYQQPIDVPCMCCLQELLSVSTFPIPPERLIEMAKDVLRAGG